MTVHLSERRVRLQDTTLREGEQAPGVTFKIQEKLEIAQKLDHVGIDIIEAGNPRVSKDLKEAVTQIGKLGLKAQIFGHARTLIPDVDEVIDCDVDGVGIFLGSTDTRFKQQLRISPEKALGLAVAAVEHAKSHGLKVKFTAEDATRADQNYLIRLLNATVEAGADRVSLADTVGVATPVQISELFTRVGKEVKAPLEVHCHNDLGSAVANCLAAWQAGAEIIDVTVNGLGERAGIASLSEVAVALKVSYGIDTVKLDMLPELSLLVEKYSGLILSPHTPVVGENSFSHKSGVHTAAVLVNPAIYEAFPPDLIGRQREIVVDKYAGRHAVKAKLERLGIRLNDEQVIAVVNTLKENPAANRLRDTDLIEVAEQATGLRLQATVPKTLEAMMLIQCESNVYTSSVARRIRLIKGVSHIFEISGDYDIEAIVVANTVTELNETLEKIREVKGVHATNTRLVLKKF